MKVITFDVSSSLAQFRKSYSTTSTLTFSIPPPSAIRGLVGSILGMSRFQISNELETAKLGVSVGSEIRKSRIMTNYINTKLGISPSYIKEQARHIQVRVEYIREPRYRVFFSVEDLSIMSRLRTMLIEHKSHFTPYLGTACCIAQVTWCDEHDVTPVIPTGEVEVFSAVPRDWIKKMSVKPGSRYMVERVPVFIDSERTPIRYMDMVFDARGGPIAGEFCAPLINMGGERFVALV